MATRARKPQGSALDDALSELRAAPPKGFTQTRNAIAARLKAAGEDDAAAEVKRQKKPTASVWAVSALAREAGDVVSALLEAGSQVRLAQRKALSGVGANELRDATRRVHDEVYRAAGRASELLRDAGESTAPAILERVRQTLLAVASGDDELRDQFRSGAIDADLSPAGFGLVTPLRVVPAPKEPAAPARTKAAATKADREAAKRDAAEAKRDAAEAKRRAAEEKARLEEERRREEEARKERARLEKALHLAEAEARRLEKLAATAEERARAARQQAEEAQGRADEARRALKEAQAS